MNRTWHLLWFLSLAVPLGALASGGGSAQTDDGRLALVGSWWEASPGWQGRWWWKETGGSAWVRAGGWEMGPLAVGSGGEGWRHWYPSPALSSGHWGVGLNGGPWGGWAIQDPDRLEGGLQGRFALGSWSFAAGTDRSWVLEPPAPSTGLWVDRGRVGVTWDTDSALVGIEGTAIVPAAGPAGWWGRGRALGWWGPWSWSAKGDGGLDPTAPRRPAWSGTSELRWDLWSFRWTGRAPDPLGTLALGWAGRWLEAAILWGPESGWEGKDTVRFPLAGVLAAVESSVAWTHGTGELRGGVSAEGSLDQGRWSAGWTAAPGPRGLSQTVKATWKEGSLEGSARWRSEGFRLGWIGPGTSFDLSLRWSLR